MMEDEHKGNIHEDLFDLSVQQFVNENRDFKKVSEKDLEAAFELLRKRCPKTWNRNLETYAREFNTKIMVVKQFHINIKLAMHKDNAAEMKLEYWGKVDAVLDIDAKENIGMTLIEKPEAWSMNTVEACQNLANILQHLITDIPYEGRPFVREWLSELRPCFMRWVSLSNTKDVILVQTLKYFFAAFGQPGVVSSLADKGEYILESLKDAARAVESRGRGDVEDYYWTQKFLSTVAWTTHWPELANVGDRSLQISQLENLPKNWLIDSNDWVHVFAHAVSPEISLAFKKMVIESVARPDYMIRQGPPKTYARSLAKCREYMQSLSNDNPIRYNSFVTRFTEAFGRQPSRAEDYVWNIVDFARCSVNVPSAKDVLNVKRMVEQDEKFKIVSVKNGYSKKYKVRGSGYRDFKLLVLVEFADLVLRGVPNVQPKTVLICELQILCEKWLDNKKTTSLSYKILRAEVLNSLFRDFRKYRTREYTTDLLAYATAEEAIKHGWCNLAKVADFSVDNPDKLLCSASIEGWNIDGATYLIEDRGANIEVRFDDYSATGCTPLILAAKHGNTKMVQLLIKFGCNLNSVTPGYHSTALHWATQTGHAEVVRALIKAQCDIALQEINGDTAKDIALKVATRSRDLIVKMIDGEDLETLPPEKVCDDYSEVIKLVEAASEGKLLEYLDTGDVKVSQLSDVFLSKKVVTSRAILLLLIWSGGQVQKSSKEGFTALHWASRYADLENTKLILDAKADVNATDTRGFNPLYYAEWKVDVFKALLKAGSDPKITIDNPLCNRRWKFRDMATRYK